MAKWAALLKIQIETTAEGQASSTDLIAYTQIHRASLSPAGRVHSSGAATLPALPEIAADVASSDSLISIGLCDYYGLK